MTDRNMTDEDMAEIVAEEMGVESDTVELPPGVRRGITLFELEDGKFGFIPTTQDTTLMDALVLAMRVTAGIQADLTAQKVMEYEDAKLKQMQTQALAQQKADKNRSKLVLPRRSK